MIRRFVSAEFNRFLDDCHGAEDINVKVKKRQTKADKAKHRLAGNTQRLFVNIGRLNKLKEGAIVRPDCDKSGHIIQKTRPDRTQKNDFMFLLEDCL